MILLNYKSQEKIQNQLNDIFPELNLFFKN